MSGYSDDSMLAAQKKMMALQRKIFRRPPGGRLDSENPAPGGRRLFCKQL